MKNKKLVVFLIITNIILIGIIISLISRNGIIKEKQVIKEMSESTQVTDLNNQINALNTEHTDYVNYIQTCKTKIATALTNEGVTTLNEATLETMAENIGKILQARTKDATATAEDIAQEKTAWVNGELVTGTAVNNKYTRIKIEYEIALYNGTAILSGPKKMEAIYNINEDGSCSLVSNNRIDGWSHTNGTVSGTIVADAKIVSVTLE